MAELIGDDIFLAMSRLPHHFGILPQPAKGPFQVCAGSGPEDPGVTVKLTATLQLLERLNRLSLRPSNQDISSEMIPGFIFRSPCEGARRRNLGPLRESGTEGGIMIPNVPPAAIVPAANLSE